MSRYAFSSLFLILAASLAFGQGAPAKAASAPATPNVAGTVVLADGQAQVSSGGKAARGLKAGDTVNEGDRISSTNGEVHVKMQDAGFIVVRPNTQVEIVSYKADGGDDDKGVFRLISGGLRSISGWIGKFNRKDYVVKTATATIGIRGTDHETRYIPEGSPEGEAGTYDRVYAGETVIETPEGQTTVSPNQAGFQSANRKGRPRLLKDIPGFFRPGPHEADINAKHAAIQQEIDQRREERRKVIREKAAALKEARAKTVSLAQDTRAAAKQAQQQAADQRKELKAKHDALRAEITQAEQLRQEIVAKRKELQDKLKTGDITQPEVRTRRQELKQKNELLAKSWESIKQHRKELLDAGDAQLDEQYDAALARAKALHDQQLETREKRDDLQQERESAVKEIGTMQKEENQRYRQELKADKDPPKQ
ncbi:MAG TPA: hypothetical protein VKR38_07355 [Usitatibacter sp.]|nr:hypothetical protein [Usitatibacter sp.]